jgi:hypothetical protein
MFTRVVQSPYELVRQVFGSRVRKVGGRICANDSKSTQVLRCRGILDEAEKERSVAGGLHRLCKRIRRDLVERR